MRALSEADWQALYRAWLDGIVLVVRGQSLTMEEFLAYSRRFGRLKPHRVRKTRHAQYPELTVMGRGHAQARRPGRQGDLQSRRRLAHRFAVGHRDLQGDAALRRRHSRRRGGDTLFASMYEAYESLPESLKKRIDGLQAEHAYGGRARKGIDLLEPEDRACRRRCIPSCAPTRRPAASRSTPIPPTSCASRGWATPRATG